MTSSNSSSVSVRGVVNAMTNMSTSPMCANMLSDDMSESSSPDSPHFDETDLLTNTMNDDVTTQLAAAGKCRFYTWLFQTHHNLSEK